MRPRPRFFGDAGAFAALHPQEFARDPKSEFLTTAVHHVPVDDLDLTAVYEAHIARKRGAVPESDQSP